MMATASAAATPASSISDVVESYENFPLSPSRVHNYHHRVKGHPVRLLYRRQEQGHFNRQASHYTPGWTPEEIRGMGFAVKPNNNRTSSFSSRRRGFTVIPFTVDDDDDFGNANVAAGRGDGISTTPLTHDGCINTACFSEDGRWLYTGSDDRTVKIWDVYGQNPYCLRKSIKTGHANNIFGVQVVPGSPDTILTCAADGTVRSHHIEDDGLLTTTPALIHERIIASCRSITHGFAFWEHTSGPVVFTAQDEGKVMRYDLREPGHVGQVALLRLSHRRGGRTRQVKAVAFPSRDNTSRGISPFMMCVGGSGATVEVYDIRHMPSVESTVVTTNLACTPIQSFRPRGLPHEISSYYLEVSVSGLVYSRDRPELLVSYQGDQIYGFDTSIGAEHSPSSSPDEEAPVTAEAWSLGGHLNSQTFLKNVQYFGPREEYIASGSDTGHTWLWDRQTGIVANLFKTDDSIANGCVAHPHTPTLVCYGIENTAKVVEVGGKYRPTVDGVGDAEVEDEEPADACRARMEGRERMRSPSRPAGSRHSPAAGGGGGGETPPTTASRGGSSSSSRRRPPCTDTTPSQRHSYSTPWNPNLSRWLLSDFLQKNLLKVVQNPSHPDFVYDRLRYRAHVRRMRRYLDCEYDWREEEEEAEKRASKEEGGRRVSKLPDYPEDICGAKNEAEYLRWAREGGLDQKLVAIKEKGNEFFKAGQHASASFHYMKVQRWIDWMGHQGLYISSIKNKEGRGLEKKKGKKQKRKKTASEKGDNEQEEEKQPVADNSVEISAATRNGKAYNGGGAPAVEKEKKEEDQGDKDGEEDDGTDGEEEKKEAEEALARFARLDDLYITCLSNIAACSLKQRHYNESIDLCNDLLALSPNNVKAFFRRGIARFEMGGDSENIAKAYQDLKRAEELSQMQGLTRERQDIIRKLREVEKAMQAERQRQRQQDRRLGQALSSAFSAASTRGEEEQEDRG